MAYLTFDADVKEEFVEDKAALQAMFQLAKVPVVAAAGPWAPWHRGNLPEGAGGTEGSAAPGGLESWAVPSWWVRWVPHCHCSRRTGVCSTPLPPRW